MDLNLGRWRGMGTIVTDAAAHPLLWLEPDGDLHDALGAVTCSPKGETFDQLDDLILVIGEWLVCASEHDGPTAYANIHPELRDRIYELVPSVILATEEDEAEFILS